MAMLARLDGKEKEMLVKRAFSNRWLPVSMISICLNCAFATVLIVEGVNKYNTRKADSQKLEGAFWGASWLMNDKPLFRDQKFEIYSSGPGDSYLPYKFRALGDKGAICLVVGRDCRTFSLTNPVIKYSLYVSPMFLSWTQDSLSKRIRRLRFDYDKQTEIFVDRSGNGRLERLDSTNP